MFWRGKDNGGAGVFFTWFKNLHENGYNFIKASVANWDSLNPMEKANVKRFAVQLLVIGTFVALAILAGALMPPEDDMPSDNPWHENFLEYTLLIRTLWEQASWYNPLEWNSLLQSPIAASRLFDRMAKPWHAFMFWDEPISTGAYKGWHRGPKWWLQLTPYRNAFELKHPELKSSFLKTMLS
jgi:hypothetical protein